MKRIRSKLIILRLALLGLFHLNCAKEPINFENEMVQRDNKYFLKGQNEPYNGPIYSSYSNNTLRSKGDVSDGKKDGLWNEWYENGEKKQEGYLGDFNYKQGSWNYWDEEGRKYLQEISTVVISWYFPIALITATIIAVSAALTMACPQIISPDLTSFLL